MGWLYMQSLKGHAGPRQYLDAQFTYERSDAILKVRAGSGCLNSFPRKISGVLPGLVGCGAPRLGCDAGRA